MKARLNIEELRSKNINEGSIEALALEIENYSTPVAINFFLKALGTSSSEIGIDPNYYKGYAPLEGILLYVMDIRR